MVTKSPPVPLAGGCGETSEKGEVDTVGLQFQGEPDVVVLITSSATPP